MSEGYTVVKTSFLDELLSEVAGNVQAENLLYLEEAVPSPEFKVRNMGEGEPHKEELKYAKALKECLEKLYGECKVVLNNKNLSTNQKLNGIDEAVEQYVVDGQALVEMHVRACYEAGVERGRDKLSQSAKVEGNKTVVSEWLDYLVAQQQENIEDMAMKIRGRIRMAVRTKKVLDRYG